MDPLAELRQERRPIIVPSVAGARVLATALDQGALPTWEPPAIYSWSTWLQQRFESTQLNAPASKDQSDFVLAPQQELAVWELVLEADGAPRQAAPLVVEAWRLAHAWRVSWRAAPSMAESEDVQAFRRWSAAYLERTAALGATDSARLLTGARIVSPQSFCARGFIAPPPAIATALSLSHRDARNTKAFDGHAFVDRESELAAAFEWACTIVADPAVRVVIALDGMHEDTDLIRRCLQDRFGHMHPAGIYLGSRETLGELPSLKSALAILELPTTPRWDALGTVITSPHIEGAGTERAARAQFDATLRARARYELPLAYVLQELKRAALPCPTLVATLTALATLTAQAPRRQALGAWLVHFEHCLQACGWPGPLLNEIDARMAVRAWSEIGDRLQTLATIVPALTISEARRRLRAALADTLSPVPAGSSPAVYIVTPEEASLLAPTHLWLAGAESSALLPRGRPSPFLPFTEQRAAGVPGANATGDLLRAQQLLSELVSTPSHCVASYSAGDGEQVFSPSALIPALRGLVPAPISLRVPAAWRQPLPVVASIADDYGPPIGNVGPVAGGVAVLAAQAACPFRAFARYRLRAEGVAEPQPGIDARAKGNLVHRVLALVWAELHDQSGLLTADDGARRALIEDALLRAERLPSFMTALERELSQIERVRVTRLIETWLAFEASCPPFTVHAVERPALVEFAGLTFNIRIDRIDRSADDRDYIVDYKTGICRESAWYAPRLDEPQLPFYAMTDGSQRIAGIAFAQVRLAAPKWIALPRPRSVLADEAWAELREAWSVDLELLADELKHGHARRTPKRGQQTCRLCDQHLLCRIAETAEAPADERDESDPGNGDSDA